MSDLKREMGELIQAESKNSGKAISSCGISVILIVRSGMSKPEMPNTSLRMSSRFRGADQAT